MKCKFCNAEIGPEDTSCPFCGKALVEEEMSVQETDGVTDEVSNGEPSVGESFAEEIKAEEESAKKPMKNVWKLVLAIIGAVAALGVLAVVLLTALGVEMKPRANDIHKKDSYTVADDKAVKKGDTVVAVIGGKELTNAQLQIYYRMQILDFANYYGSYLSYMGMDLSQPLSAQQCYFDESMTWEQYFIDIAIKTWQNYQVLALLAEESGFTLDEEWQTEFEALPEAMEEQAAEGGYENAAAMVTELLGPACTMDDYMAYIKLASLSSEFYTSEYERLMPTAEEIEAYFAENEASFTKNGITKESGLVSSVRHILVCPEGGTTDEEGNTTYSDDEWAACLKKAEEILAEWKAGDATEESFAALANIYSEDGGSNTNGGLYKDITPSSSYVESFLKWSVDMARQTGDTEIVKTSFGYHIMYFVSGEAEWINSARTNLLSERTTGMIDDAQGKWPMKVTYRKIALAELKLA